MEINFCNDKDKLEWIYLFLSTISGPLALQKQNFCSSVHKTKTSLCKVQNIPRARSLSSFSALSQHFKWHMLTLYDIRCVLLLWLMLADKMFFAAEC